MNKKANILILLAASVTALPLAAFAGGLPCPAGGSPASALPLSVAENVGDDGDYAVNFAKSQDYTRKDRHLDGIALGGSKDGSQSFAIAAPRKVYTALLDKSFTARAGEKVTPSFSYTGTWMHGFVYLDRDNDGRFDAVLGENGNIPEGSDVMAFAYAETQLGSGEGYNSDGVRVTNANVLNPPSFTIPADLPNGYYRLRYKVDWASIDPAGRMDESNSILRNGGGICDIRLNVHGDYCIVNATGGNGEVLAADGQKLEGFRTSFGQPLTVRVSPEEGFSFDGIRVRHGYNLSGDSLVHGTPQYEDVLFPAYLFRDGSFAIPGEFMDGEVEIHGIFVEKSGTAPAPGEDYALNFDKGLLVSHAERKLNGFTMTATQGGSSAVALPEGENYVYRDMTGKQVSVVPGDEVSTAVDYTGRAMHLYLYVDFDQDGRFSNSLGGNGQPTMASELVSYTYYEGKNSLGEEITELPGTIAVDALPAFRVPSFLPTGVYRARLKVDWNNIDPAGQWSEGGGNLIDVNGGSVVDFLLNVHNPSHKLQVLTENGSVHGNGVDGLPDAVPCFQALELVPTPAAEGYVAERMTIRHGHNLDGPQYVRGNRQWGEFACPASAYTLPKDSVDGDVLVTVNYVAGEDAAYKIVFSDEFNAEDGSQPDGGKWMRCQRMGATWNRWLSDSEEVIYIEDGKLVARAIPNPDQEADPVPMITGGIKSMGKFGFTYGKVECRAKSNPWTGNFPAIWMMPEDQSAGWPDCGEIDIWEVIDDSHVAYHTVHSNWTYDLKQLNNPQSSFNEPVVMDRYHTYGLEWDENLLTWYVDGRRVASYAKSANATILSQGQWPFDKHFHLILNQSVGNNAWAADADVTHTYETDFDWIRVYQKTGQNNTTGISAPKAQGGPEVSAEKGAIRLSASRALPVTVCDVSGRTVYSGLTSGEVLVKVQAGVYVVNGKKVFVP